MLDLDAALCWSPRYRTVELPGERWALLGPSREFVLSATQLGDLVPEPGGAVVPRALLSAGRHPAEDARRIVQIQGLLDAGVLVPAGAIEAEEAPRSDQPSGVRAWVERLGWPVATEVFIADHAFDSDLHAFDRQRRASGDSWVLVVPCGDHPLVGPYFDAREPARPCWSCYAAQLRHNQPLRRWLLHHRGELPRGASPRTSVGDVHSVFQRMAAKGPLFAELTAAPVVFALEGVGHAWIPHPVRRLPQCPSCGSAAAGDGAAHAAHAAERPLVLRSAPARYLDDGGFRVSAPEQTVAGLRAWVSPLTGLFRDIGPLHPQPRGLSVHRASYGVCPLDRTIVEGKSFVEEALGKGISAAQSAASALGEATERLAAHYRGDECILVALPEELPAPAILPGQLVPFSERQYRAFEGADSASPDAVLRYREDLRLEWTPAWSIGRQAIRYVPASYCYTHAPFDGARYCRFTSNGGAAGSVVEEAILQGLCELVERDAVAIWWYNQLERPEIERADPWRADADRVDATIAGPWEWWALDLTHDFELPVAAAVARHRGGRAAFGFGCHIEPRLALRRALTELCQLIVAADAHVFAFDFDAVAWEPYLLPGRCAPSSRFVAPPPLDRVDLREVILDGAARAQRRGLDVLVHDYGRPDFPLRTAKVIIPGLNHIWPRLGCPRLYDVPVAMGWLARSKREDELNPSPLWL